MRETIYEISELTYSKEMLDKKPSKIASYLMYLILTIGLLFFVWASNLKIDLVIDCDAIVKSKDANKIFISNVEGQIKKINYKDGEYVKEGDIVYQLHHEFLKDEIDVLNSKYNEIKYKFENQEKLKKSVIDKQNYFDKANPSENRFYYIFEQYRLSMKENAKINNMSAELFELNQIVSIDEEIERYNKELSVYDEKKKELNKELDHYIVKANKDGYISYYKNLEEGNLVLEKEKVFEISSKEVKELKLNLLANSKDLSKIEVDDEIVMKMYTTQGENKEVIGRIASIDFNQTLDDEKNYFVGIEFLEEDIKKTGLIYRDEMKFKIKIKIGSKTILDYLISKF